MRHISITACLLLITLAMTSSTTAAAHTVYHKTHPTCNRNHTHIITADTQAVVYSLFDAENAFGCAFSQGHQYELGPLPIEGSCGPNGCLVINHIVLAGPLVAYEYFSTAGQGELREEETLIVIRDLRNGHILHRIPTGTPIPPSPRVIGSGPVESMVLKSDGSVAWINEYSVGKITSYEVHAFDKTGSRVLATGTNIVPNSLALAGSTLYWIQEGKPFSAMLH
jgi:hypothetical protein